MESDGVSRVYTGRGFCAFSPWLDSSYTYSALQLYLGSNFISRLEVVSALNSFNIGRGMYTYDCINRPQHYNPKIYLSAIQTTSIECNFDRDYSRENLGQGEEKSGS